MELTHNELLSAFGGIITLILGAIAILGKLLVAQVDRRLEERFATQESARAEAQKLWMEKFAALEQCSQREAAEWQRLEREILTLKADLPMHYVRREDYIRNQSVIEAKIDGLALKIENALLRGRP